MKRIFFSVLALSLVLFSCDKENIEPATQTSEVVESQNQEVSEDESLSIESNTLKGVSISKGVITFSSIEDYEALMVVDESGNNKIQEFVDFVNNSGFQSYGTLNEESEYDNYFMDALMNKDKIVKIGEWYIYIDMSSETVLALSDSEENAYYSLLNADNRNIKTFDLGDDVLDHLQNNTSPDDRSCGGIGSVDEVSSKLYVSSNIWYRAKVDFNRYGVFFTLGYGYESNDIAALHGNRIPEIKGPEGWWRRKPCNSSSDYSLTSGVKSSFSVNAYSDTRWVYQNTRNLNGVYLYCKLSVDGVAFDYVGVNVNSPY